MKATRIWLGVVAPAAWVVIAVGTFVACWTRLPDPLATHWGWSGTPNGAMPRVAALGLFGGAAVLAALAARVAIHREQESRSSPAAPHSAVCCSRRLTS